MTVCQRRGQSDNDRFYADAEALLRRWACHNSQECRRRQRQLAIWARSQGQHEIVAQLLTYANTVSTSVSSFTANPTADALIRSDPFAFLLAILSDQGIAAERTRLLPYILRERLGTLDPRQIAVNPVAIPLTKPVYAHDYARLSALNPFALQPVFALDAVEDRLGIRLVIATAMTETEIRRTDVRRISVPITQEILAALTRKVMKEAGLPSVFAELYPRVRDYAEPRCFGQPVALEDERIRDFLAVPDIQYEVVRYLARAIGHLTPEKREIAFENQHFRLAETESFLWQRRHVRHEKTILTMSPPTTTSRRRSRTSSTVRPTSSGSRRSPSTSHVSGSTTSDIGRRREAHDLRRTHRRSAQGVGA